MRWLLTLVVLVAGCAPMVLTPVVVREPRPEPLPLTIGVHYPEEVRSFRKVPRTIVLSGMSHSGEMKILVGEASVKLFDDALGLLFARVVGVPTVTPVGSAEGDLAAVIEPRIMAAALDVRGETGGIISSGDVLARATVVYALT